MMTKPWSTYYDNGIPHSLSYPVLPVDHLLVHTAHKYAKETAVIFASAGGRTLAAAKYNYKELNMAVYQFAAGLQRLGLQKGDRVAIMLPNCPQFIIAINAVWRLGAIAVCAEGRYASRHLEEVLLDSGCKTIITTEKVQERLAAQQRPLPLERIIYTDVEEYLPWQTRRVSLGTSPLNQFFRTQESLSTIPFGKVFHKNIASLKLIEVSAVDTAVLLYSHYRANRPAGVQLTHRNLAANATAVNTWCQINNTNDRRLAVVPFSQAFGLTVALNAGIFAGDTLVILHNLLQPEQIVQAIHQYNINILPATPAMLTHMAACAYKYPGALKPLQQIISSGLLPPETQRELAAYRDIHLIETFGQPETCAIATMNPLQNRKPNTLGLPLPDTQVMIADADLGTQEMPPGEIGEIIIRGPQVMQTYWRQHETAADKLRVGPDGEHGWYFTGHLGFLDEDGFLVLAET